MLAPACVCGVGGRGNERAGAAGLRAGRRGPAECRFLSGRLSGDPVWGTGTNTARSGASGQTHAAAATGRQGQSGKGVKRGRRRLPCALGCPGDHRAPLSTRHPTKAAGGSKLGAYRASPGLSPLRNWPAAPSRSRWQSNRRFPAWLLALRSAAPRSTRPLRSRTPGGAGRPRARSGSGARLRESVENAPLSWRRSAEESSGFSMTASVCLIREGPNNPRKVFCLFEKLKKKKLAYPFRHQHI